MDKRVLWIVEMLVDGVWRPTMGIEFSREEGRLKKQDWSRRNPYDRFRLVKYVPKDAAKEGE